MKKSEFLKELATILHEMDQEFKDKGYNVKALILADKLDKLGISPPPVARTVYDSNGQEIKALDWENMREW